MSVPGLLSPGAFAPLDEVPFAPVELRVIGLDLSSKHRRRAAGRLDVPDQDEGEGRRPPVVRHP